MWNIDISTEGSAHEMAYIANAGDQIKLYMELTQAIEARNVDGVQLVGTVKFDDTFSGKFDQYEDYEKHTLEEVKKLLVGTEYFTIKNGALILTQQGLDQVPDGRAIFF